LIIYFILIFWYWVSYYYWLLLLLLLSFWYLTILIIIIIIICFVSLIIMPNPSIASSVDHWFPPFHYRREAWIHWPIITYRQIDGRRRKCLSSMKRKHDIEIMNWDIFARFNLLSNWKLQWRDSIYFSSIYISTDDQWYSIGILHRRSDLTMGIILSRFEAAGGWRRNKTSDTDSCH
jgi:hypothetical protein